MSNAVDKIKEGFSELAEDLDDLDMHCNLLESKLRGMQNEKEKFLTDLSILIDQYSKKSFF